MRPALLVATLLALATGAEAAAARDRAPLALRSAVVEGAAVTVAYGQALDRRVGPASAFEVFVNGVPRAVRSAAADGTRLHLRLDGRIWSDDEVRLLVSDQVRDRAGNRAGPASVRLRNVSPAGCSPALVGLEAGASEAPSNPDTSLRSTGRLRVAMLFVDFAAAPADESVTQLYDALAPPLRTYFRASSYGRLTVETLPLLRWLRLAGAPRREYEESFLLLGEAIRAADPLFDFRGIDAVHVVLPRSAGGGSAAFTPESGSTPRADGRQIGYGTMLGPHAPVGTRAADLWQILVHETAHLLGLPDLYDPAKPDVRPLVGPWDPMGDSRGQDFLAWHKLKLGWLDPPQLRCLRRGPLELTLTPVHASSGVAAIAVRLATHRALVVEARRRRGRDAALCGEGVLVYEVDASTAFLPVTLRAARRDAACGAPFAPGTAYAGDGVRVSVLAEAGGGYRVRVSRAP